MFAIVGCGSDDSQPKETPKSTTPPGSTNTSPPGSELNYVEVCQKGAKAYTRFAYCSQKKEDINELDEDDYKDYLDGITEDCKNNKQKELFECANPKPAAMQTFFDAVTKAADCDAIDELEDKYKAICSSSNNNNNNNDIDWVEACKAYAVHYWMDAVCNYGWTEAERDAELADSLKDCEENEQSAKEDVLYFCSTPTKEAVEAIKSCVPLLKAANGCPALKTAYDKCDELGVCLDQE